MADEEDWGSAQVFVDLSDDERRLLMWGTSVWVGTGIATDSLAEALGFANARSMKDSAHLLRDQLEVGVALPRSSWRSVLAMTEFGFSSQVFGAGLTWSVVTGLTDVATLRTLREVQRKFRGFRAGK